MFSRIDHRLSHKRRLNKFKEIGVISNIFSNHNITKLKINYRRRLNNMLLKKKWVNEESNRQSENALRQVKIKTQLAKIFWNQQKQF